jgi:hypothetical protein
MHVINVLNFNSNSNKIVHKYHNHGTLIELIWTITPALVLIVILVKRIIRKRSVIAL